MNQSELIILAFVAIACLIGIIMLLRELSCWYFKINERTRIAQEQLNVSKQILKTLENEKEQR